MADTSELLAQKQKPGVASVIGTALGDALALGVIGAVGMAALAGVLGAIPQISYQGVGDFLRAMNLGIDTGGPVTGALASGGVAGGVIGAAIGVVVGGVDGVQKITSYYEKDVLPKAIEFGVERGKEIGMELEHEANLHDQQAANLRAGIQKRDPSFVAQHVKDQAKEAAAQLGR